MAISVKHAKTSAKTDGGDSTLVQPSDWNADLVTSMATGKLLGRTTASAGAFEEITPGASLSFSGGALGTVAATGDVTSSANSLVLTIAAGAVTFAKMASAAIATAGEFLAATSSKLLSAANVWAAVAETDNGNSGTSTIACAFGTTTNHKITATGNFTLGVPTGALPGMTGHIRVIQDGTGSRTISYNAIWKIAGGTAGVLSTAASAVDVIYYEVIAASGGTPTLIYYSLAKAYA